jgi:hypothetical protein
VRFSGSGVGSGVGDGVGDGDGEGDDVGVDGWREGDGVGAWPQAAANRIDAVTLRLRTARGRRGRLGDIRAAS